MKICVVDENGKGVPKARIFYQNWRADILIGNSITSLTTQTTTVSGNGAKLRCTNLRPTFADRTECNYPGRSWLLERQNTSSHRHRRWLLERQNTSSHRHRRWLCLAECWMRRPSSRSKSFVLYPEQGMPLRFIPVSTGTYETLLRRPTENSG